MNDPSSDTGAATIRRATADDAATLSKLSGVTFIETFVLDHAMPYSVEDLAEFLVEAYGLAPTQALLADPATAWWLVEQGGEAIGYALAGACTLPYPEVTPACGELKRLYLRASARGGGLGARLLATALEWLEGEEPRQIWIGVWSGNVGAQRLYARHGFEVVGEHTFPVGRTIDREFAMRRG